VNPAPPAPAQSRAAEHRAAGEGARRGGRPQARHGAGAEPTPAGKPAASPGAGATGSEGTQGAPSGAGAPESLAAAHRKRHGKGGGGKERERAGRELAERAKEAIEHEAQARQAQHGITMAAAALSTPAATAAATTQPAAPPPASPAPTLAPTPPAVVSQRAAAATGNGRRAAARAAHGRTAAVAGAPAAAALAAARIAGTVAAPVAHPAAGKPKPKATNTSSPALITTVTKFINVVPAAVRWIIGALIALALALAISSRVAALRARRLARQRRELLADVGLLQAALLPALPERIGDIAASAAYKPASGPGAGGDFYDVFELGDGQLGVIVGDVSGHGRAALPHTTLVRYTLRAYLEAGLSPRNVLQAAAPVLERQLGEGFATVVLATFDPGERTLVYSSAGHPPPIVIGLDPEAQATPIRLLTRGASPPIGAGQPTGLRQTVVELPGDALVCFYTDGVVEARVDGALYGAGRLTQRLAELGPEASAGQLLERVAQESDRRPDDMAACVLHVEGEVAAPRVALEELELGEADRDRGRSRVGRFLLAGGVAPEHLEQVVGAVDGSLAQHGGVVLELQPGENAPEIRLRRRNVAVLRPQTVERSYAKEVNVG
jgi:serine phosphatase RsbU (regulator of sigma subunit)